MADAPRESVESWKSNPWRKLPTWAKWTAVIVGALLLLGIGGAVGSSNEGDLKDEVSELKSQLADVKQERDTAEAKANRLEGLKKKIVAEARDRADSILSAAKHRGDEAEEILGSLEGEVEATEEELASVEGSLGGAEEIKAKSTIPGNGTFRAEVDFIPGTYRSSGGEGCYWATLNSADPFDIASNENATGPTIASIQAPYFQTQGCGTWKRIGE
jgi:hypothetical protein